jgi:hypothetical protein
MKGFPLFAVLLMIMSGCAAVDYPVGACAPNDIRPWRTIEAPENADDLRAISMERQTLSPAEFEYLRFERWYELPSGETILCRLPTRGAPDDATTGAAWVIAPSPEGPMLSSERMWVVN